MRPLHLAALALFATLPLTASATEYTLDDIAYAAGRGYPESTLLQIAETQVDWGVDEDAAVRLLRAGVPESVIRAQTDGALPTPIELAAATFDGPAWTTETLGVPTLTAPSPWAEGQLPPPYWKLDPRGEKERTSARRLGTVGAVIALAAPAVFIQQGTTAMLAGDKVEFNPLFITGMTAAIAGPLMLGGGGLRECRVLSSAGARSQCIAATTSLTAFGVGVGMMLLGENMQEPFGDTLMMTVPLAYVASVGAGIHQLVANRRFGHSVLDNPRERRRLRLSAYPAVPESAIASQ